MDDLRLTPLEVRASSEQLAANTLCNLGMDSDVAFGVVRLLFANARALEDAAVTVEDRTAGVSWSTTKAPDGAFLIRRFDLPG
ncbi:MAG TPA: hypothetical protein VNT60_01590 [Deinococcales bacterium]|nr:hypothetical protein [Deinococcales bacterium]